MNWTANPYQYAALHQVTSNGGDVPCGSTFQAFASLPCSWLGHVSRHPQELCLPVAYLRHQLAPESKQIARRTRPGPRPALQSSCFCDWACSSTHILWRQQARAQRLHRRTCATSTDLSGVECLCMYKEKASILRLSNKCDHVASSRSNKRARQARQHVCDLHPIPSKNSTTSSRMPYHICDCILTQIASTQYIVWPRPCTLLGTFSCDGPKKRSARTTCTHRPCHREPP